MIKKFFLAVLLAIVVVVVYYYLPESKIPEGKKVTRIVVKKQDHAMLVYAGEEVLKKYAVSLNKHPKNPDDMDEDRSVPSGEYFIFDKDSRSKYHKSIGFSAETYQPEPDESKNKRKKKKTGYRIHGMKRGYGFIGKFHRWTDWTKGGIALTDDEMDDLFTHVENGVVVVVTD